MNVYVMMDIMKTLPKNVILVTTNVLLVKLLLNTVSLVVETELMPQLVTAQSILMMKKPQLVHLAQMLVNLAT